MSAVTALTTSTSWSTSLCLFNSNDRQKSRAYLLITIFSPLRLSWK